MVKAGKTLLFGLLSIGLLAAGCIGAQYWWHATHHRYDQPDSGYYYGGVNAIFNGTDDIYSFKFTGQSQPRWQWVYSTNFVYRRLQFEWWHYDLPGEHSGTGTVSLPSLAYESSRGTGVLTRAVLSQWLLGTTNGAPTTERGLDGVFAFIMDAGRGTLPAPRHHTYYFEQPVRGCIQHFRNGFGVGGYVYVWIAIWVLIVVIVSRRFFRAHPASGTAPLGSLRS